MPKLERSPVRMDCLGLDLSHAVDRMPPGYFPYIYNVRVLEEGIIEPRPGYSTLITAGGANAVNSIRRLNDTDNSHAPSGYIYVGGNGAALQAGVETAYGTIDTGYSGNPLSLITFRPNNSPESWMYVYDANKQVKVRPDGTTRAIGVAPPNSAPSAEYGIPATAPIADGFSASGWTGYNSASSPTATDRESGATAKIGSILYNTGNSGWCCIVPTVTSGNLAWAGQRMRVVLGGITESVQVREIHPPITSTTVAGIAYDSGTTGACSIVFTSSPQGLARNSLITIDSELVRVLSVNLSADGTTYSIRCRTNSNHAAGASVTGNISWYLYTVNTHAVNNTITIQYLLSTLSVAAPVATPAAIASLITPNASVTGNGRPIDPANDYMHISLFLQTPANVLSIQVQLDIDAGTTTVGSSGNAFTNNYWTWTIAPNQLNLAMNGWTEIIVPISSGVRTGIDQTRTFANIAAAQVKIVTSAGCNFGFDGWYFFGTYGPTVALNSPVGLQYLTTYRDSSTGAASLPGPITRHQLFPLREAVIIGPVTTTAGGVDSIDIYRIGNTLSSFVYDATIVNNSAFPQTYLDYQPDAVIAANPAVDTTLVQPWPVLDLPWSGTVSTDGTSVFYVSGTPFNTNLLANTVITINGTDYQLFGNPHSTSFLEIQASAGVQTGVAYQINSPTLAAQPLPFAFGTLEGPFAPVLFAILDPKNPGTLYYSNTANLDAASDQNTIEICAPSESLISGAVWNGLAIIGSRDNIFLVRYSYLTSLGIASNSPVVYQFNRIPSPSGMWSTWACTRGPDGVYFLGRDGIYKATDAGAVNISDEQLYPLFPHDGQQPSNITSTSTPIPPVNMQAGAQLLRLSCCDQDIFFDYVDTANNNVTLRYEIPKKRWFLHYYGDGTGIAAHYLDESSTGANINTPNPMRILLLSRSTGLIYLSGGITDNGTLIPSLVNTPSYDLGDERAQKLFVEAMTDADSPNGAATLNAAIFYNNNSIAGPTDAYTTNVTRQQFLTPLNTVPISGATPTPPLAAYRNISIKYFWSTGIGGPRLFAFEPSAYMQPFLSERLLTQTYGLSIPGWKHHRRLYPGIISTAPVTYTIYTQDGRVYQYTIPSTGGLFRIIEQMLDQDIKDLAFAYELDGGGTQFALFPDEFTVELKEWRAADYTKLPVFAL